MNFFLLHSAELFIAECKELRIGADEELAASDGGRRDCSSPPDSPSAPATARASFGLYNTREEVDALVAGLRKVLEVFGA